MSSRFSGQTYLYQSQHYYNLGDKLSKAVRPKSRQTQETAKHGLGAMSILPVEVIQMTLLEVDLKALLQFRAVNRHAQQLVEGLHEYKAVITHAQLALRGSLRIGAQITLRALNDKLCTTKCDGCGDFGGYLYLITCQRVCFRCICENPQFLPLTEWDAREILGLKGVKFAKFAAQITVVAGLYGYDSTLYSVKSRFRLLDYESARDFALARHGYSEAMKQSVSDRQAEDLRRANEAIRVKNLQISDSSRHRPQLTRLRKWDISRDEGREDWRRFAAIVVQPPLNKASGLVELGFYCVGCRDMEAQDEYFGPSPNAQSMRQFTESTFATHLQIYGDIQNDKHVMPH
ncbi:hypothetical protein BT63DRAFT_444403 [Microthyrium microscopicum]|uniref:F-box domain-containing protein n=1 Tax=Microthyrium microscopicum TaxID=703497 RepID=A0A6A6TYA0_9PEZI|nr:hypothetical protein BT63DRAFT_444403 [Microthyrium microscopicum]